MEQKRRCEADGGEGEGCGGGEEEEVEVVVELHPLARYYHVLAKCSGGRGSTGGDGSDGSGSTGRGGGDELGPSVGVWTRQTRLHG